MAETTKTLAQMRARAQTNADMDGGGTIAEADWNAQINDECRALYDKLITAFGLEFYKVAREITVSSGSETTDLTAALASGAEKGVLHVVSMDAQIDGKWREIYPLSNWSLRNEFQGTTGWEEGGVYYALEGPTGTTAHDGPTVRWFPVPDANHTVRLFYVPNFVDMDDDADTFDGINGWEQWVEYSVALWARIKTEDEVQETMAKLAMVEDRIAMASKRGRKRGVATRVKDVRAGRLPRRTGERGRWSRW